MGGETVQESVEALPEIDPADVAKWEGGQRLWIRALMPIIQHGCPPDPSPEMEEAYNRMYVAACRRLGRILSTDIAG